MQLDWFTVAAQLVNFAVLVFLLKRFLYAPITNAMARREQRVTQRLRDADAREAEARERGAELAAERAALEATRGEWLERARQEADAERTRLLERARASAREREVAWRAEVEAERTEFCERLRDESARWATAALGRALRELADAPVEDAIVRVFLRRIASLGDGEARALAEQAHAAPIDVVSTHVLSDGQREAVRAALQERLGVEPPLRFAERAEPGCGIELFTSGLRVAWSVESYLEDLGERLGAALRDSHASARAGEEERAHVPPT